jgi:hypothetical protein
MVSKTIIAARVPRISQSQFYPLSNPGTAKRMRSGELLRYDKVLGVALD